MKPTCFANTNTDEFNFLKTCYVEDLRKDILKISTDSELRKKLGENSR